MPREVNSAMGARFHLLGPLRVTVDGAPVALGGTKQRVLLAHLALNANKLVPFDQLVQVIWPSGEPPSAHANLQTYVWRLRGRLPGFPPEQGLITHHTGYSLVLAPDAVDARVFEELRAAATRARQEGSPQRALELVQRAEALWSGDPLEDLPAAEQWAAEIGRLLESRLTAIEERLSLQVRLGAHDQAIAELLVLLDRHPYRERLWQQYMLALNGSGRRADALGAYASVRERLVADLGVEPGPELRAAHATVLSDEEPGPPVEPEAEALQLSPLRQLPPDVADFTGRRAYLRELEEILAAEPKAPVVAVVAGSPGAGKSALALHAAHRLRERFPDGQLYVDLGATGSTPRDPADVLTDFLLALGVIGAALPTGLAARSALLRSRLAGRRVLLLLDDAATAEQVQPLLPGDGACAVLITTRGRLVELAGARHLELDVFGAHEAISLLAGIVGAERVRAEPEEAATIVRFCGYLPLAIRIAGARLAGRQAWNLRTLRERLSDESNRLSELRVGDLGVRSSFELSVRQLPRLAVLAFGRLAALGGQDFASWAVEAVLDQRRAHEALDCLVDANLVELVGADAIGQPRYRLHDLLRYYASEVARGEPEHERRQALARALEALLSLTQLAAAGLPTAFGAITTPPANWNPEPGQARALVADPLRWFEGERTALNAGVELAVRAGLSDLAWRLTAAAVPFFDLRCHYEDWRRGHERALTAARASGDLSGQAALLRGLGQVHLYHDEYAEAERDMAESAALYGKLGDRLGSAFAVAGLGTVARVRGRATEALGFYRRALTGFVGTGEFRAQGQMLNSIGTVHALLGETAAARQWLGEALTLAREIGDEHREAKVLTELGTLHRIIDNLTESLSCLRKALSILESINDERCTAYALLGIGQTLLAMGETVQARGVGDRALQVFRQTGNLQGEAEGLVLLEQSERAQRRLPP
ncbi:tetratricopeptide repeat protein [Allokutzneria sp. A3M-2-11 16]|uniref:AfsR/SARP family transcriptional regulator n=1 Tax=Allokutzneria sp. A3M-2-11 16 TaxID=2962043 RepID=UPI0020B70B32|nr:AfsR/SARP family transcriptional regulator [Allokutzneria sp. A3M-2-11 16]MCP3804640.1 tetratricopeptide repeat protein [Allokutzneria sp. A3M-2-11 16]